MRHKESGRPWHPSFPRGLDSPAWPRSRGSVKKWLWDDFAHGPRTFDSTPALDSLSGGGLLELEDEDLPVRTKRAASGGLGFGERVGGEKVSNFGDEPGGGERFFNVIALEVDIGIDLVGEPIVPLIFLKANIMRGGANPQGLAMDLERRFPDS